MAMMLQAVPVFAVEPPVASRRAVAPPRTATVPDRTAPSGIRTLAADDDIPGVPLSGFTSTFTGTLSMTSDLDDVFSVTLGAGDTLSVSITAASTAASMDLFLYQPGSTTVLNESDIIYASDAPERD